MRAHFADTLDTIIDAAKRAGCNDLTFEDKGTEYPELVVAIGSAHDVMLLIGELADDGNNSLVTYERL